MGQRPIETTKLKSSPSQQRVGGAGRQPHFFPVETAAAHVTQHSVKVQGGGRNEYTRAGRTRPTAFLQHIAAESYFDGLAAFSILNISSVEPWKLIRGWGGGRGLPYLELCLL